MKKNTAMENRSILALNLDLSQKPKNPKKTKVAIITGAGQGLGAAAARLFASHGARVLVADLDGEKAESVAAEIAAAGVGGAAAFAGDVTAPEFAPRCVRAALDAFGGGSIDILVNNAGEFWKKMEPATLGRESSCCGSRSLNPEREREKNPFFSSLFPSFFVSLFKNKILFHQATPGTAWPTS